MRLRLCLVFTAITSMTAVIATADPDSSQPVEGAMSHVVVELTAAPLAEPDADRLILERQQRRFTEALHASIPTARVYWHYRLVENGMSVIVPTSSLDRLNRLPGVRQVYAPATYHVMGGPALGTIGVRSLSDYTPATAGAGIKIGIIDDGIDQTHPFFNPAGFTMPPGFPKGQLAYTTAKVIVARSFPPPGTTYAPAKLAFDRGESIHGTHVAGIAAGDANTQASGLRVSGVAPRAYLGNYRALTVPTDAGVGLDGNAPELVAAIEAAVADGMDVINLSLGEPEIEPGNDIVAKALDAAADAGVVATVAAGNDYGDFGAGSVTSPGTAEKALTVAASSDAARPEIASFSSAGPSPVSLRLKPEVTAPGVGILSSVPGGWSSFSGTSMAAPHVAGAAALLLQRHPGWTPAQVKAALIETATPLTDEGRPASINRAGSGLIDVATADTPLLESTPVTFSLGLVRPGDSRHMSFTLADAGGGPEPWSVTVEADDGTATYTAPPTVTVPGTLDIDVEVAADASDADLAGMVVLTRGGEVRRVPFWGRVRTPALASAKRTIITAPGLHHGNTRGRPALVSRYLYPQVIPGGVVHAVMAGPEQVFRFRVARPIANFGVVVTSAEKGVDVEPRIVFAGDENRLTGYAALPLDLNPYLEQLGDPTRSAGTIAPARGAYDIVFDSTSKRKAGRFTFRFWVNDTTPPNLRLLTSTVRRGAPIRLAVSDTGSGFDPATMLVRVGGRELSARFGNGILTVPTTTIPARATVVRVQVSDHQETRNMENVGPILPNTTVLRAKVTITKP